MSIDTEDFILAHNIKVERQAIPVVITAAINEGRIQEADFVDDGLKDLDEMLKNEATEAKKAFQATTAEFQKAKSDFTRRNALKDGTKKPKTQRDQGLLLVL